MADGKSDTSALEKFTVSRQDGGFRLRVETDDGAALELTATRDQLDVMADALDDILADTEDDEDVDGEDQE
jgi:hypothetical protein